MWVLIVHGCTSDARRPATNASASDTIVAERLALIGQVDGAPEYLFGDVTSVSVGPGPVIYVADRIASTVRAYRTDGSFLGTVATEGQGPGELEWPNDLSFDPVGRLYVRDAYRITVFARPDGGEIADSLVRTTRISGYANLSSTRARSDGTRYFYPTSSFRDGEPDRYFYLVYDSVEVTSDTVAVPGLPNLEFLRSATYRTSARGGRMVNGVNRVPFEPVASWDITATGSLFTSTGDRYEVVEWTSEGDTASVTRIRVAPRPIPSAERGDSARSFQQRIDSLPVRLEDMLGMSESARAGLLPNFLPEILATHATSEGTLWLRRWPAERDQTLFDVVELLDGSRHAVLIGADLLLDPPPYVSNDFVVGVVQDPLTEVERVAVFGLEGP